MPAKPKTIRTLLVGPAFEQDGALTEAAAELVLGAARAADLVIAVDGGLDVCVELGIEADLAVGDWDSLKDHSLLETVAHLSLPTEKSRSDLFHALEAAIFYKASDVLCVGVTGGRPDHHLASLMDLSEWASAMGRKGKAPFKEVSALDTQAFYVFLGGKNRKWKAAGLPPGQIVSVFAWGGPARGVTLKGMKYPLKNVTLLPSSHGLSNEVLKRSCEVNLNTGRLLIVAPTSA